MRKNYLDQRLITSSGLHNILGLPRITTQEPIPADKKKVPKHLQAVMHHAYARGLVVGPSDWHLSRAQAMALREKSISGSKPNRSTRCCSKIIFERSRTKALNPHWVS